MAEIEQMSLLDPYTRWSHFPERRFGGGGHEFRVVDNWAKRHRGWGFNDIAGVAVDSKDNVYVFNRTERPIQVFDKDGNFVKWFGERLFTTPHGISIGPDDTIYCADTGDHTVKRLSPNGEVLMMLGERHQNAPRQSGQPFNMPTHATIAPNGDLYISDGYGNSHVHVFTGAGDYKFSWGSNGPGPSQFSFPHSIVFERGLVYVVDRSNNRIQVFNMDGSFVTEWTDLHQPDDIVIRDGVAYVAELEHRMSIWKLDGTRIASWGDEGESLDAGEVIGPHGLAMDSEGSLFVGDLSDSYRGVDRGSRALQKFVRV